MKLNLIKKVFNMERKGTYKYSQEELDRNKIIKITAVPFRNHRA